MSGRKTSSFELNLARQERVSALGQLQTRQRELKELLQLFEMKRAVLASVSAASVATKHFAADDWRKSVRTSTSFLSNLLSSTEELRHGTATCVELIQSGTQLMETIEGTLNRVYGLQTRLKCLEMDVEGTAGLLSEWLGDAAVKSLKTETIRIMEVIRSGDLTAAETALIDTQKKLQSAGEEAVGLQQEAIRLSKLEAARSMAKIVVHRCNSLAEFVKQTPGGLKDFFNADVAQFQKWHTDTMRFISDSWIDKDSNLDALIEQLARMHTSGETVGRKLEESFVAQTGVIERECETHLSRIEAKLGANEELLTKWMPKAGIEVEKSRLNRMKGLLANRDFLTFQSECSAADADITREVDTAILREQSHEKRIYLVSAIVEVCEGMGFRMTKKAHLEDAMDRASSVCVTFDTGNRGEVMFAVSLDSIEVDSCIAGTHCFEEFQKLSEQLREEFGVETHFRGDDCFQPKKIRKGEMDEPTGSHQSAG